jgi:hypothetical protein
MNPDIDPRLPNDSTTWQLWYLDTFDPDSPPSLEASGQGILQGLGELWLRTLKEGILDNGNASFSYFQLAWGKPATARLDLGVGPFNNASLLKLRRWAGLMSHGKGGQGKINAQFPDQRTNPIITRLAHLHYEILQKSSRLETESIDWSLEARELLRRVEIHNITPDGEAFSAVEGTYSPSSR